MFITWFLACAALNDDPTGPTAGEPGSEQTEDCAAYISCITAAGGDDLDLIEQVYGPTGECWVSASEALACNEFCEAAIVAQEALTPSVAECWGGEPPPTELLFDEIGSDWLVDEVSGHSVCDLFAGAEITLDGSDDGFFYLEVQVDLPYFVPQATAGCEFEVDRGFTCVDKSSVELGWTGGSFTPNFGTLNLSSAYTEFAGEFDCDVKAKPQ
jgi:hypothetical protein